jgi:fructuronate reductase
VSNRPRLSRATLNQLPRAVRRPDFDPASVAAGIVHLGLGAFARAHIASYTQPLLAADPRWGMFGASLLHADTHDALAPQDFLYCRAERDRNGERLEVMAALTGVAVGTPAVLLKLLDPAIRIVTLTVTEKGYCRDTATGALNEDDPVIRADLAQGAAADSPASVPGLLVAAIRRRRAAALPPFTVLSCDNLPANGAATRHVVARFAELVDPSLGRFIADELAFPDCMVDRIVPATTAEDRTGIDTMLGVHDAWPVVCEKFSQWVIEDRFPQGRPAWETTGAELVADVRPYEDMKLRLLNGSHSSIAYLGQLAGWNTIADVISQPELAAHIAALMNEIATTLRLPASVDPAAYRTALLTRFANPALRHRTAQIAMDGSQKLPQRLFAPALDRIAAGQAAPRIALGVAAWLRFLQGKADDGTALGLNDPQAVRLRHAACGAASPIALCDAIFAMPDIVPPRLARSASFRGDVVVALERLARVGAAATLRGWSDHPTSL